MKHAAVLVSAYVVVVHVVCGAKKPMQSFGHDMLPLFSLEPGYLNLNHGSYGSAPIAVQQAADRYRALSEVNPDRFMRSTKYELLERTRKDVAEYIGARDVDEVVLVENASSGINSVLRSLKFNPGDKILILEDAYPMIEQTAEWLNYLSEVEIVRVSFSFPVTSDDDFLESFRIVLQEHGPSIRAAVVEHTMSTPAVVLPIADIFDLVRTYTSGGNTPKPLAPLRRSNKYQDAAVCIADGAHAMGNFDFNPEETGADVYVSNGHKWLYSVRGSALLWVRKSLHSQIVPHVVSSEAQVNPITDFVKNYGWTGTRDHSGLLSLSDAIEFRESIGGDHAVKEYMNQLARFAEERLSLLWETEVIDQRPGANMINAFANVRLPFDDESLAQRVFGRLENEVNTIIPWYRHSGHLWVRISCQIYNDESDIQFVGESVLRFMNELEAENFDSGIFYR